MSDVVIKVDQVSKLYRLGKIGTGTLSHDLKRWWARIRGKEDPFLKIGETNDRTAKGTSQYVWAVKDISFEVKRGEVLGVIGRNGAGKSTLLKILSRTTSPTTGSIKAKGRIASLLEVGVGFHPELSGRENIFLNGAILGMSKNEISSKFDEIVAFAGIERYVDTPVKRYSSGMYVRLAFAVAAHLESEILIIDEVLAVGDADFQKKCLGKMGDIASKEGRTVLFVSHNLHAIKELCDQCVYMKNGQMVAKGPTDSILGMYNSDFSADSAEEMLISTGVFNLDKHPSKKIKGAGIIKATMTVDGIISDVVYTGSNLTFTFQYKNPTEYLEPVLGIVFKDQYGEMFSGVNNRHTGEKIAVNKQEGTITVEVACFKGYFDGRCYVDLYYGDSENNQDVLINALSFQVVTVDIYKSGRKLDARLNKFYDDSISFK